MSDLINRQAILKHIEKIRQGALMMDDIRRASIVMTGMNLCEEAVGNQPSAQTERKKGGERMSVIIKSLNLRRKDSGEYFVQPSEVKGVEVGVVVMTLLIDQKTQKLRVSLWNPEKYGLKESYPCIEIEPDDDLISRTDAIIDANERAGEFWLCDDEVNATIQFLMEQTAIIPAERSDGDNL